MADGENIRRQISGLEKKTLAHHVGRSSSVKRMLCQDIDDLLSGITAEDLDDFASTENENRREDGPGTAERITAADLNSSLVNAEESFSGFSTATGKTIAPPSKAALEKAKRLWHQMGEDGFQTGQGAPVPSLYSAHSKKAPMIFQEGLTLNNPSISSSSMISVIPEPQPGTSPTDLRMGFQTGRGATIAEPSSSARRKALNMFAEIESTADCLLDITSAPDKFQSGVPSSFLLASAKSAPTPNRSSVAKVMSLFPDVESSPSPQPTPSQPLRSSAQHQLPASQPSTPLRKPLMTTTDTYLSKAKSNAIKTPVTVPSKRLSLKQYHLHPQYNSYEELAEMGIYYGNWLVKFRRSQICLQKNGHGKKSYHSLNIDKGKIVVGRKLAITGAKEQYWSERTRLMERKEKEIEKLRELGMLLIQYAAETSPSGWQEESSDTMEICLPHLNTRYQTWSQEKVEIGELDEGDLVWQKFICIPEETPVGSPCNASFFSISGRFEY
ncbi:breast cancer 2 susceptibility protein [Cryptococcus deuterogattii MMRL2647]|nr:breast cancer 2 susceptibility protein [Cryptococcus deuterogattii MMRL2647]